MHSSVVKPRWPGLHNDSQWSSERVARAPAVPVIRARPFGRPVVHPRPPRNVWGCCWVNRQHGVPALGIPQVRGFPQTCALGAACRCFWLDARRFDWTSGRRMLRPQKPLPGSWIYSDRRRYWLGLPRIGQPAGHLVPAGTEIDGSLPVGEKPASLLRSAELLLHRVPPAAASDALNDLRATVADLVGGGGG